MISDVGIKQIESEGRGLDFLTSKKKKVYGMVSLTLQKSVWLSPTPYPPSPRPGSDAYDDRVLGILLLSKFILYEKGETDLFEIAYGALSRIKNPSKRKLVVLCRSNRKMNDRFNSQNKQCTIISFSYI